jgi:hypothetical protein
LRRAENALAAPFSSVQDNNFALFKRVGKRVGRHMFFIFLKKVFQKSFETMDTSPASTFQNCWK